MAQETTNIDGIVDDPLKAVEETSEKAKYASKPEDANRGDATNPKAWATEYRKDDGQGNNTVGVIRGFDGTEFEYDVAGLGEYSIEKNRAEALAKAVKHFEDNRPAAQHEFDASGSDTATDGNKK
jgi:hypothetical protein